MPCSISPSPCDNLPLKSAVDVKADHDACIVEDMVRSPSNEVHDKQLSTITKTVINGIDNHGELDQNPPHFRYQVNYDQERGSRIANPGGAQQIR